MKAGIAGSKFLGGSPAYGMVLLGGGSERVLIDKQDGNGLLDAEYQIMGIPPIPVPPRRIERPTLSGANR